MQINNVEAVLLGDLANASHDINQLRSVTNVIGRGHYSNVQVAIATDDKFSGSTETNDSQAVFVSLGYMKPWCRVGQIESLIWDSKFSGNNPDLIKHYSTIVPNFNYDTGEHA